MNTKRKAVVTVGDILSNTIFKMNTYEVERFSYDCCRKLDDSGKIYGPMEPTMLSFRMKVDSSSYCNTYYSAMASKTRLDLSFLFDVVFEIQSSFINSYEDGMVVNGYVTNMKQVYKSGKNENGKGSLMMLDVEMLVCSVVYIGSNINITEVFIK